MATWDLLFSVTCCWERGKSGDLNNTGRLVCVRGKVKTNYAFSITMGLAGKASEIALCLGTFYHWKNMVAISSKDLKKQRDEERRRGWGMRRFSFTADHRWRLDHLTNSFHLILFIPSPFAFSSHRAALLSHWRCPLLKKKEAITDSFFFKWGW